MKIERNKGKRLNQYVPDYTVFDLETTGISCYSDSIIEISGIKVRNHQVTTEFSTLVNPERPIPAGATRVNGITNQMVGAAPRLPEALAEFLAFIGDDILVGHNIHAFDLNFIFDDALRLFNREVNNAYVDTLYLSRQCLPQLKHHKLADVSRHFNIDTTGAHRALADCLMNQKCYEELGKLLIGNHTESCPRCGGQLMKRKGKFGEFYGCGNYPQCRFTRNLADGASLCQDNSGFLPKLNA